MGKANHSSKFYFRSYRGSTVKGRGAVHVYRPVVQKVSLRVGDTVLAGTAYGEVRAMTNERGEKVK